MKKKTIVNLIILTAIVALIVLGAVLLPDLLGGIMKRMHGG
jgi:hypothetical protein